MCTGIDFLAFRRQKTYTHLRPTEHSLLSESAMGPEPPFRKSRKPVVTTAGTGFFRHFCTSGVFEARLLCIHGARLYPAGSVTASIRPTIAANSRRVRSLSAKKSQ